VSEPQAIPPVNAARGWRSDGVRRNTFQRAETLPHGDDDIRHVERVGAHLERERFVKLWRHVALDDVTLDDVSSFRLDDGVLAHQTDLRVEVCVQATSP